MNQQFSFLYIKIYSEIKEFIFIFKDFSLKFDVYLIHYIFFAYIPKNFFKTYYILEEFNLKPNIFIYISEGGANERKNHLHFDV